MVTVVTKTPKIKGVNQESSGYWKPKNPQNQRFWPLRKG